MSPASSTSLARRVAPSSLLTVAFCVAFGIAASQRTRAPAEPAVVEASTIAEALATARERDELVALDFTSDAAPCSAALRTVTSCDPWVRAELARDFVHVELDAERDAELFRACFGTGGFLASCVLDADGDVLAERAGASDAGEYARLLARARDRAPAVRAARELVALAPDDPAAWCALGEAREAAGNLRLAEAAFRRAAELASEPTTMAIACERLARFAAERGDNVASREALARARALATPELAARASVTEGLIQSIERRPRLAVATLQTALDALSEPAERTTALLALARAHRDSGDDRAAIATFARLLAPDFEPSVRACARDSIVAIQSGAHGHAH
ncbi:MAG: tetratricopeptide repeat protein [Planctomycetes bacterium]|nr:tetratricopeptide repeat protein [Planctomycetota bacterium]